MTVLDLMDYKLIIADNSTRWIEIDFYQNDRLVFDICKSILFNNINFHLYLDELSTVYKKIFPLN